VSATQLYCPEDRRRDELRAAPEPKPNAIDWLEVLPSKRALAVHCMTALGELGPDNVAIEGGVRITGVKVVHAHPADELPAGLLTTEDQERVDDLDYPDRTLVVLTDSSGDYSTYTLRLRGSVLSPDPPEGFDRLLYEMPFSFKVDCQSDFDCREELDCPDDLPAPPHLDYLAKDFASFRRLMLDRLSQTVPDWDERNPVDVGMMLVELIAYAADQLSYHQDAVATEAYLGTARKRASVRRHARLLDYPMHDGANARAWVFVEATDPYVPLPEKTKILSEGAVIGSGPNQLEEAVVRGATVFETLHDAGLRAIDNEIEIHTWGDPDCCLPRGATRATLVVPEGAEDGWTLTAGTPLLFEELAGPTDRAVDADPFHRHVVRLTADGVARTDDLPGPDGEPRSVEVLEVEWAEADALPFSLRLGEQEGQRRAIARANLVLADHGLTVDEDPVQVPLGERRFRPVLTRRGLTHAMPYRHKDAVERPAVEATRLELKRVLPHVSLDDEEETWLPQRDLLGSDRFAAEFVVEMEEDGRAVLRFGDDRHGRRPPEGIHLAPTYRIGTGPAGNVGAGALTRVMREAPGGIAGDVPGVAGARNPLPATGGTAPEPIEQVRLYAPQAFRRQERAVTEADYAAAAELHPQVQRAAATRRWTGSWHTMYVTVDRLEGRPVDKPFEDEMTAWLDRFRLAGYDVEIDAPHFVPLDLAFTVCVEPGYIRTEVMEALLALFSSRVLPGGRRALFHPDERTFGEPVRLSPLIAAAMGVEGVGRVTCTCLQRWGGVDTGELAAGILPIERLEIAQLENDRSRPEAGRVRFDMEGGL
jgi:hypothetical protein